MPLKKALDFRVRGGGKSNVGERECELQSLILLSCFCEEVFLMSEKDDAGLEAIAQSEKGVKDDRLGSPEVLDKGSIDIDLLMSKYLTEVNPNLGWREPVGGFLSKDGGQIGCDWSYSLYGKSADGQRMLVGVYAGYFNESGDAAALKSGQFIPASELSPDTNL